MEKLGIRGGHHRRRRIVEHRPAVVRGGRAAGGSSKTIDNDLEGTMMTFGFDSAVACATDALDRLHTTAESHNRVMILEVMGRYAGWIAVYAGVAGGGDVILIPEIPFTYESICAKIRERETQGKHFTLVVVAEGAREKGGEFVTAADQPRQPGSPAGRHRRGGRGGNRETNGQGKPGVRAGPPAARRQPDELRSRALLHVRRRGGGIDRGGRFRTDGGVPGDRRGIGADHRRHSAAEDRAAHGKPGAHGRALGISLGD